MINVTFQLHISAKRRGNKTRHQTPEREAEILDFTHQYLVLGAVYMITGSVIKTIHSAAESLLYVMLGSKGYSSDGLFKYRQLFKTVRKVI